MGWSWRSGRKRRRFAAQPSVMRAQAGAAGRSAESHTMARRTRRLVTLLAHFGAQALLCAGLWILVGRARNLGTYPGHPGLALAVLVAGCVLLGALGHLPGSGRFVASVAVALVSIVVLTEFYRVYVVDFVGGPPTFWVTLRETASINVPWAIGLALLPIAGWQGTRALRRRWGSATTGSNGAA